MGFAIIPEEVIDSIKDYSGTELIVLLVLVSYSNPDGLFWPSLATICEKTGLKERRVKEALKRLVGLQVIKQFRDKELTPGHIYAWGDKIKVRFDDIFRNQEVRIDSIFENEKCRETVKVPNDDIKSGGNAVNRDIEELEEKKISTFSSSKLNTYGETAKVPIDSISENMSSNRTFHLTPGYVKEIHKHVMDVFSHVPEQRIIEFFNKRGRIVEKHEPMTLERLTAVTDEAIIAVMEYPNEATEYTGRGIWGFFCKCWDRIRFGDTRFHIWNFSTLDAESYRHRKNYKKPTEEELEVRRAEGLVYEAENEKRRLYNELREYLSAKDKYLQQEESIEKNRLFLESINEKDLDAKKKTVPLRIIEELKQQKQQVGEKLALIFRRYKFTEERFNQECDEFLVFEEKRLKELKAVREKLSKETWYVGADK